jgi:hypothetical protein
MRPLLAPPTQLAGASVGAYESVAAFTGSLVLGRLRTKIDRGERALGSLVLCGDYPIRGCARTGRWSKNGRVGVLRLAPRRTTVKRSGHRPMIVAVERPEQLPGR